MQLGEIHSKDIVEIYPVRGWRGRPARWLTVSTCKGQYYRIRYEDVLKALKKQTFIVKKPRVYHHLIVEGD